MQRHRATSFISAESPSRMQEALHRGAGYTTTAFWLDESRQDQTPRSNISRASDTAHIQGIIYLKAISGYLLFPDIIAVL